MNPAETSASTSKPTYAVTRYAHERDNLGKQNLGTWDQIVALLSKRDIRESKSGSALSPVLLKPGTSRANANVLHVSMAVADIDSTGTKDASGRFIAVTKRAPDLKQLRPAIDRFRWVAVSSHGHDPRHPENVVKYRLVLPLSRPAMPEEWPLVWAGMNAMLNGCCDPAARDCRISCNDLIHVIETSQLDSFTWQQTLKMATEPSENIDTTIKSIRALTALSECSGLRLVRRIRRKCALF
jgi:hypothetical protein